MNDTESTATILLTGHDRHRILDDLWAVAGLGEHIHWMSVHADTQAAGIHTYPEAHVAPLAIAHGLLDNAHPWTPSYGGKVYVSGRYRGVDVLFVLDVAPEGRRNTVRDRRIADAALADLKAAIGGAQS